jgi:hypothetical protein
MIVAASMAPPQSFPEKARRIMVDIQVAPGKGKLRESSFKVRRHARSGRLPSALDAQANLASGAGHVRVTLYWFSGVSHDAR